MGLFSHYMRVFIRSNFKPINPHYAQRMHTNTTVAYFILAWTVFGATMYQVIKGLKDPNSNIKMKDGKLFTVYDAVEKFGCEEGNRVIHISGFTKMEDEVLTKDEALIKASS